MDILKMMIGMDRNEFRNILFPFLPDFVVAPQKSVVIGTTLPLTEESL